MLPYILIGLYLLVAIFVYCIKEEIDKRKGIYSFDKSENIIGSIFWLPGLLLYYFMVAVCFIGEYIIQKPISFIIKHTFSPIVIKFVDFLESKNKKEN